MQVLTNNISFQRRVTPDFIKATNIMRNFRNQGLRSPSYIFSAHLPYTEILKIKSTKNRRELVKKNERLFRCSDNSFYLSKAIIEKNPIIDIKNPFFVKFFAIMKEYEKKLALLRDNFDSRAPFKSYDEALQTLKHFVMSEKMANCQEQSILLKEHFDNAGLESKLLSAWYDHCFLVVNMDKNANILKPRTWGKDAFIADPWLGKVFHNIQEGLNEYKRIWLLPSRELRNYRTHNYNLIGSDYKFPLYREHYNLSNKITQG